MKRPAILLPWLLLALPWAAHAAGMLTVEQASDGVSLQRAAQALVLKTGDSLQQDDAITLGPAARLSLRLHRYGLLELGAGSMLRVTQLPFSSYASDLHTELQLQQGYLHLVWKRPGVATSWPLAVALGDMQASLISGEYFFERGPAGQTLCVSAGEALLARGTLAPPVPQALKAGACYALGSDAAPTRLANVDFIALRNRGFVGDLAPPTSAPAPAQMAEIAAPAPLVAAPPAGAVPIPSAVQSQPTPVSPPTVSRVSAAGRASGDNGWTLNVSSRADMAGAEQEAAKLRAAGYTVVIAPAQVKGRQWYRVQIRGLANLASARALAAEIEQKLGYQSAWPSR